MALGHQERNPEMDTITNDQPTKYHAVIVASNMLEAGYGAATAYGAVEEIIGPDRLRASYSDAQGYMSEEEIEAAWHYVETYGPRLLDAEHRGYVQTVQNGIDWGYRLLKTTKDLDTRQALADHLFHLEDKLRILIDTLEDRESTTSERTYAGISLYRLAQDLAD